MADFHERDRADGTRRYRVVVIFIPRKNGKTTLAAGIPILCLFTDDEPGAEAYTAAERTRDAQAAERVVFLKPAIGKSALAV